MTRRSGLVLLWVSATMALAQDPVATFPNNYRVVLENRAVRVLRVHYGPHEKLGVHDHWPGPTAYVYLNDSGQVRFQHVGQDAFAATRPAVKVGSFRASPGNIEQHSVENLADTSSDLVRVEMKLPLHLFRHMFRGAAPSGPLKSMDAVEFTSEAFNVERVICMNGSTCELKTSASPSVVVALTALRVAGHQLARGDVAWLDRASTDKSEGSLVTSGAAEPAHLLRILITYGAAAL